jgi:hypothetical protein
VFTAGKFKLTLSRREVKEMKNPPPRKQLAEANLLNL